MGKRTDDPAERLMVALDVATHAEAMAAVEPLKGAVQWFKVGSQLFTACGPRIIEDIKNASGAKIFLDLKFHDIPATVALSGKAAAGLGVDMFNMHALGGPEMMSTAVKEVTAFCASAGKTLPIIIAVTILTSMTEPELKAAGVGSTPAMMVLHLARNAKISGLDGVVASPQEARMIKEITGDDFLVVTPGVRPAWAAADDQARIMTPSAAIEEGADYIVVGRPILKAGNPKEAALRIIEEISSTSV
ncbi:MAG: orotidine-5'-phosphate decarboxylase [Nitrospinae bacterium]|nr:orotidine-5'-phosphate decarboxylase [Nitrospinota bacterium]